MSLKGFIQKKKSEPFDQQLFLRRVLLIMYDVVAIFAAGALTILLRFNLNYAAIELQYIQMMWKYLPINIVCTLLIFAAFKLYSSMWQYAGPLEAGINGKCGIDNSTVYRLQSAWDADVQKLLFYICNCFYVPDSGIQICIPVSADGQE